jgi:glycosyltransferase involved in cell wall biosynthesis
LTVLFFGQLIPLHGVDTILEAALLSKGQGIHWTVIGRGQGEAKLSAFLDAHPDAPVRWIHWLQQEDLVAEMGKADVCLGVFGTSDKAARVIPNKVYQILAAGRPLITRDSPAIRELIGPSTAGVWLVPPADPPALLKAVQAVRDQAGEWEGTRLHQDLAERIAPQAIGGQLSALLHARLVQRRQGAGR